ncbi:MAG: phosphoribosylpyrophosphate synthetase [Bacteroidia bacterium]
MLGHYDSLPAALKDLDERGFKNSFDIKKDHIYSFACDLKLGAAEFDILETYRFDGPIDPSDSVVVYAIQSCAKRIKGTLIVPSVGFSEELTDELSEKFKKTIETP